MDVSLQPPDADFDAIRERLNPIMCTVNPNIEQRTAELNKDQYKFAHCEACRALIQAYFVTKLTVRDSYSNVKWLKIFYFD